TVRRRRLHALGRRPVRARHPRAGLGQLAVRAAAGARRRAVGRVGPHHPPPGDHRGRRAAALTWPPPGPRCLRYAGAPTWPDVTALPPPPGPPAGWYPDPYGYP